LEKKGVGDNHMPFRIRILEDGTETGEFEEMDTQTFLASLDEEQQFVFEERAAIIEFEAGLTRAESEMRARTCIPKIEEERTRAG
jgi:hypothetical protein